MTLQPPAVQLPADDSTHDESRWQKALREITTGNALITFLAIVMAIIVGGILIILSNEQVQTALGYFFSRPADTFAAMWDAISGAYGALFRGAVYNTRADDFLTGIRPLFHTVAFATPLIAAALGIALAFRVGLFNIGARGQFLFAAIFTGLVSTRLELPVGLHLLVAVAVGIVAGALYGGLVGLLKAKTGAHEVIVTIMLNFVAFYLLSYLLRTPVLQGPRPNIPSTGPAAETAQLPYLFGSAYRVHWGFVLVVAATVFAWWLISRSSLGFKFRAVGLNPQAARTAGINVNRMYIYVMLFAGGYAGLAASSETLGGQFTDGFTSAVEGGLGFDAITVALLGRSNPWGVFAAGLLIGGLRAGSFTMQSSEGIAGDIVLVVQSLIVLFIAAPPLIRAIFRLPDPSAMRRRQKTSGGVA